MANLNAVDLRTQVEQDRASAHEEIDRKFNLLLEAVSAAYDVGNLAPIKPKRARARKAANENGATPNTDNGDTTPPPANSPTEGDGWKNSEAFKDACVSINTVLVEAGKDGLAMSAIVEKAQLAESVARDCIKDMVTRGTVVKTGNRRGTRYLAASFATEST